jgi:hypothetical protein
MEIAILFWAMMLAAGSYSVALGGWEGRTTMGLFVLAALATIASNRWLVLNWQETNLTVCLIDTATFVATYLIAVKSRRWWPIWVAAFQLNSVAAHVATMISPDFSNFVYQGYASLWALPSMLIMVFGIFRDRLGKYRYEFA